MHARRTGLRHRDIRNTQLLQPAGKSRIGAFVYYPAIEIKRELPAETGLCEKVGGIHGKGYGFALVYRRAFGIADKYKIVVEPTQPKRVDPLVVIKAIYDAVLFS